MNLEDLPIEDSPYLLDNCGPIFILGCPRSGTTFLSSCIGAIPGTREFVGILAPPRMMHLIANTENAQLKSELLKSVRDTFWQRFWRDVYFKQNQLVRLLARQINIADYRAKPDMNNKYFCYKEPFLCFAAEDFAEAFPNAKFIHIIRDGRDNADSMERKYYHALTDEVLMSEELTANKSAEIGQYICIDGFNYPLWVDTQDRDQFKSASRYGRYLMMWKEMVLRGRKLNKLGADRYFEIKYEDFVKEPVKYGQDLRKFIGAPDSKIFQKKLNKAFNTSINIASKNQPESKITEANIIAKKLLNELGYN